MSNPPLDELELRARPRLIRRLNKRTLMIGAVAVVLLIAGAIIVALDPPKFALPARTELYNIDRKQTAEGLAKLPKSYAEVPVLGPPVPGDIGRAFVEGEKRLGLQLPAPETSIKPNPEEEAERAERIRQARIAQQARESSLFFHLFDKQKRWPSVAPDQGSPAPQPAALRPPVADERGPVAIAIALTRAFQGPGVCSSELLSLSQARKLAFVGGKVDKETINPHALTIQPSPYTLLAGSIISASLITGVSSDLPGQVVAQVSENAYNTVTGEHLLIPQGTRLIGKLTAWSRSARDAHYWCGPASSYRTATRS